MIFDKLVRIDTLADNEADADKEGYTVKVISLPVNIQPASQETVVLYAGNFGETFTMFTPTSASGVEVGDKVVSGNNTYTIKGRSDWNQLGLPHYEFVLFKIK